MYVFTHLSELELSTDEGAKRTVEFLGHRAWAAGADLAAVDFGDGEDFFDRAREKDLVGIVDVMPGQRSFANRQAQCVSQLEEHVPRDTG